MSKNIMIKAQKSICCKIPLNVNFDYMKHYYILFRDIYIQIAGLKMYIGKVTHQLQHILGSEEEKGALNVSLISFFKKIKKKKT